MATDLVGARTRSSEASLVERARRGDHDAFAALIDPRVEPTYRTALAILGNEADARDATQDIFVRVWSNLPDLRDPGLFSSWMGRIVVNTCRSAIRGRRRRFVREIPYGWLPEEGEWAGALAESHDERTADLDLVERALARISAAERTLLSLHHYEHLGLEHIGVLLGVPARTVKSRLFSARRALERALEVERR